MTTNTGQPRKGMSRRGFLAGGALLGSGLTAYSGNASAKQSAVLQSDRPDAPYELAKAENTLHTACLQCNTGCGIKCKIQDGVLTKIDGNPYNPWTLFPHLPYSTPIDDAQPVNGSICPKGQAGLQTAYDPYRIRKVLKRAGKRGENAWISIPFDQAVREICDGGRLFADVPGEEDRLVEGLRDIATLRDSATASALAKDVARILKEKSPEIKQALVAEFKQKHADNLHHLIDPDHPDLGPKNNQLVVSWGRLKKGRSEFYKRFSTALGTTNAHGHTTVCQGSLYFTCKAMNAVYDGGKFGGGNKFYFQADTENSEFILFVGANLFEANYGPPNRSVRMTDAIANKRMRIAVADPRFSKVAGKAWRWLPIQPGTDAALAMAIMRWMFDNERYDAKFLECANRAAAADRGEASWANGSWLVKIEDGKPGAFIRAADHGLATAETRTAADGHEFQEKFLLVLSNGEPVAVDPYDSVNPVIGDLFVDTKLTDGTHVKSALQLLREEASRHTIEEWCDIAGLEAEAVIDVARELTSHGKKAAVDIHRGPAQHTNGFYNVLAWMTVNMLLGNFDHKGGMCKATTYDYKGKGGLFNVGAHPGTFKPFGISSIRHGVDYEKTTLFDGYPAKRNWYPLSSDIYEEIVPSIGDAYPYPVKALFLYMGSPVYALPAGHTNVDVLADVDRLPLFVANDILVGGTSMYADYIFPDLTYLERWEFQGSHPNMPNKVQPIRQPVISPIPESCSVFGTEMPICFESMMLGIAEYLDLPGFGEDGFGPGLHLRHMDDMYLRMAANVAFGEKKDGSQKVSSASPREQEIFRSARRHLDKTVFDADRWREIVGEEMWPRVMYLLNRGGRFEEHEKGYDGEMLAHPYGTLLNLYQEKTAKTIHAGTGEHNSGIATYLPIRDFHGQSLDAQREGHDFSLITSRTIVHTKSRTIADPWLRALMPDNGILINPADANRMEIEDGDTLRVTSATNPDGVWPLGNGVRKPMVGKAKLTQTIRPGVVSFFLGFGHWATGAGDITVDGTVVKGESERRNGIHANAAMWVDPALRNTCLVDPVGGSVSFYDTSVNLVKEA